MGVASAPSSSSAAATAPPRGRAVSCSHPSARSSLALNRGDPGAPGGEGGRGFPRVPAVAPDPLLASGGT